MRSIPKRTKKRTRVMRVERLNDRRMLAALPGPLENDLDQVAVGSAAQTDLQGRPDVTAFGVNRDNAITPHDALLVSTSWMDPGPVENPFKVAVQGAEFVEQSEISLHRVRVAADNGTRDGDATVYYDVAPVIAGDALDAATSDVDYTLQSGSVTIPLEERGAWIDLFVLNDSEPEKPEGFVITITAVEFDGVIDPDGIATPEYVAANQLTFLDDDGNVLFDPHGTLIDDSAVIYIADDDSGAPPPSIAISLGSPFVREGDDAVFRVQLSEPAPFEIRLDYTTIEDSATADTGSGNGDFVPIAGQWVIAPGETTGEFTVSTTEDTAFGPTERFWFELSSPWWNRTVRRSANIIDDESTIGATNTVSNVPEGTNSDFHLATFRHSELSAVSDYTVSIAWGDDTSSFGWIQRIGDDEFQVFGNHTYTNNGEFDVEVTIEDIVHGISVDLASEAVVHNVAPVGMPMQYTISHLGILFVDARGLAAGVTDPGTDPITIERAGSGPSSGTLHVHRSGGFIYDPEDAFTDVDAFSFVPFDGEEYGEAVPVTITVTNAAPVAIDDQRKVSRDRPTSFSVAKNDSDEDGDPLVIAIESEPSHGTVRVHQDGSLSDTPDPEFFGTDRFKYSMSDGFTVGNTATVTLDVRNVPAVPISGAISVSEDVPHALALCDFEMTDADGDLLDAVRITSLPAAGKLSLKGAPVVVGQEVTAAEIDSGSFVFASAANEFGSDYSAFAFQVSDGYEFSLESATLTFNVKPVNDAPTPGIATLAVDEDSTHTFSLDDFPYSDVEDDAVVSIRFWNQPDLGRVKLFGNPVVADQDVLARHIASGDLTYTPEANAHGTGYTSFAFAVHDGKDVSPYHGRIVFDVASVLDAPSTGNSLFALADTNVLTFALSDFVFDDSDGDSLTAITIRTLPENGSLQLNSTAVSIDQEISHSQIASGNLEFLPLSDQASDVLTGFAFDVSDGILMSAVSGRVDIIVNATNTPPVAQDHTVSVNEDEQYVFTPADFTFFDADGDSLTEVKITSLPAAGTLLLDGAQVNAANQSVSLQQIQAGDLAFTAGPDQHGESFTKLRFVVSDGNTYSLHSADLTIDVAQVNDAPTTSDYKITMAEDGYYTFSLDDFPFSDPDAHGIGFVQFETTPRMGTLIRGSLVVRPGHQVSAREIVTGNLRFRPDWHGYGEGVASFDFYVSDGYVLSEDTAKTVISVTPINDAPWAQSHAIMLYEDETHVFSLADFPFVDPEDDALDSLSITPPSENGLLIHNGSVVDNTMTVTRAEIESGVIRFMPSPQVSTGDVALLTFAVSDGVDRGHPATIAITMEQRAPQFTFDVSFVDIDMTTPVDTVEVGDEFFAVIDVSNAALLPPPLHSIDVALEFVGQQFSLVGTPQFAIGFSPPFIRIDESGQVERLAAEHIATPSFHEGEFVRLRLRAETLGTGLIALRFPGRDNADGFFRDTMVLRQNSLYRTAQLLVVEAASAAWQNRISPEDVNGDGAITPLDALIIINEMNRRKSLNATLPDPTPENQIERRQRMVDVNGDGSISASDALPVINALNRRLIAWTGGNDLDAY
ncbi:MAG: Ig-like domain-containing protein [Candidatus Paceibacterota bacterium]